MTIRSHSPRSTCQPKRSTRYCGDGGYDSVEGGLGHKPSLTVGPPTGRSTNPNRTLITSLPEARDAAPQSPSQSMGPAPVTCPLRGRMDGRCGIGMPWNSELPAKEHPHGFAIPGPDHGSRHGLLAGEGPALGRRAGAVHGTRRRHHDRPRAAGGPRPAPAGRPRLLRRPGGAALPRPGRHRPAGPLPQHRGDRGVPRPEQPAVHGRVPGDGQRPALPVLGRPDRGPADRPPAERDQAHRQARCSPSCTAGPSGSSSSWTP